MSDLSGEFHQRWIEDGGLVRRQMAERIVVSHGLRLTPVIPRGFPPMLLPRTAARVDPWAFSLGPAFRLMGGRQRGLFSRLLWWR